MLGNVWFSPGLADNCDTQTQVFKNKFSVAHNALCRVFVAIAKTELESCCTDV